MQKNKIKTQKLMKTALISISLCGLIGIELTQHANNAYAALITPAQSPLETGATAVAKPNIMFMLDDSGSMAWDYLSDNVSGNDCKSNSSGYSTSSRSCTGGDSSNLTNSSYSEPPFRLYTYNQISYNSGIRYQAGVTYLGASMGDQSILAAKTQPFGGTAGTVNITTSFKETIWCNKSYPTEADKANNLVCKRNGIDLLTGTFGPGNSFEYQTQAFPGRMNTAFGISDYNQPTVTTTIGGLPVTPHYYAPVIREYCTDINLGTCILSSTATGIYTFPAGHRYCNASSDAASVLVVTGTATYSSRVQPRCQKNYDPDHTKARFSLMKKINLDALSAPYTTTSKRADCAAVPLCSLSEEQTNYANWYTYYRTRINVMKTSAGRVFKNIDSSRRVGFITINTGYPVSSDKFLAIGDFNITQKQAWYAKFYAQNAGNSTPMREAVSRVGRYFAGKTDGINQNMINGTTNLDPVQYSCQQNFLILTTDGLWNGAGGQQLDGTPMTNQDNSDSGYSTRAYGAYDGNVSGASGTLADITLYYYQTDLRPPGTLGQGGVDVSLDNVPITTKDKNTQQHMSTFTLGLGVTGYVTFSPNYETPGNSLEFDKIKAGTTGCPWATGICNWPLPIADGPSALDDLWHAAINGRGKFFSASDPQSVSAGLQEALAGVSAATGSSASAATSSPNITPTDNFLYYSTYRTNFWDGEIAARTIDANTGAISASSIWSAAGLLNTQVSGNSDTRTIYTAGPGNTLKPFTWTSLNGIEQSYFSTKCSTAMLSQCSLLSTGQVVLADNGQNMVNYLRGQKQYQATAFNANPLYRDRQFALGDTVNAAPVFLGKSIYNWSDPTYATYKNYTLTRQGTLFVAANDGMLHALNATTGQEMWAYVPHMSYPNMYHLADLTYGANHLFLVDNTPTVMDVQIAGVWKTVLVGGLGAGGRGWFALDVTDPTTPIMLWEMCTDSALCSITDNDIGLSFGNPVIVKRAFDGKWVTYLTSGYDNVSPGTGNGLLVEADIATGTILRKINTNSGTTTSPSGLARLNAWFDNLYTDPTTNALYGGDLNGDVWKFDLTNSSTVVTRLAKAQNASGLPQPITTKPELGLIGTDRAIFITTGKYLSVADFSNNPLPWAYQQSVYGFKDTNSDLGVLRNRTDMVMQTITPAGSNANASRLTVDWTTKKGWWFDLNAQAGERVNIDPALTLGTLNILSNVPGNDACTAGGISWYYQIDYLTGSYIPTTAGNTVAATQLTGSMAVGQVVSRLSGSGGLRNFITDGNGKVDSQGVKVNNSATGWIKTGWKPITR